MNNLAIKTFSLSARNVKFRIETERLRSLEIGNIGNTGEHNKQTNKEECHLTRGIRGCPGEEEQVAVIRTTRKVTRKTNRRQTKADRNSIENQL